MKIKNFLCHYWKSISVLFIILYLSFASPSTFKKIPTFENEDKLAHLLMYAGLAFILALDFQNHKKTNNITFTFVLICILFPAIIGGIIEILQPLLFIPRSASWLDLLFNIIGVFLGWIGIILFRKVRL